MFNIVPNILFLRASVGPRTSYLGNFHYVPLWTRSGFFKFFHMLHIKMCSILFFNGLNYQTASLCYGCVVADFVSERGLNKYYERVSIVTLGPLAFSVFVVCAHPPPPNTCICIKGYININVVANATLLEKEINLYLWMDIENTFRVTFLRHGNFRKTLAIFIHEVQKSSLFHCQNSTKDCQLQYIHLF